ncbi:MAG: glycosyltransferase family 2 protein [Nitrososphaeria archaeon]
MKDDIETSIIISTHNRKEELLKTIANIYATAEGSYEIIVVSAASNDGTDEELPLKFPSVRLIKAPDVGWGEANNIGAKVAKGKFLFFSGPDMEFESGWLKCLIQNAKKVKNLGEIGTMLIRPYQGKGIYYTGGSFLRAKYIIHKGIDLPYETCFTYREKNYFVEVDAVHYPLIPKDVFYLVGGFDPYYFYSADEMDLGARIKRAGFKNIVCFEKYMKTAMTPSSPKTLYYWNRNWIRMIIKLNSIILIPFLLIFPLLRIFGTTIKMLYLHNIKDVKLLFSSILWNIKHFPETYHSKKEKFVLEK